MYSAKIAGHLLSLFLTELQKKYQIYRTPLFCKYYHFSEYL